MEDFQEEIVKLLDVITVILAKLDEIGDNVVSEIKVILDKSRNEVALIQNSIIGKLKQEDPFKLQEQDNDFHDAQNVSNSKFFKQDDLDPIIKSEITSEVHDDVIANDEEIYDDIMANDEEVYDDVIANDDEVYDDVIANDDEINSKDSAIKISFKKNCQKKWKFEETEKESSTESLFSSITKCNKCGNTSRRLTEFRQHLKNAHDIEYKKGSSLNVKNMTETIYQCKQCDFTSPLRFGKVPIMRHIVRTHLIPENADVPEVLKKLYSEELERMGKKKKGRKVHYCNECDYSTNYKSHFVRHVAVRHNQSRETCQFCGHVCKSKSRLMEHIRVKHKAPEGQTKCGKCYKCFPHENFDDHLCEVPKYICNVCGKTYFCATSLQRHIFVEHEKGEIPKTFVCHKCDYRCQSKGSLKVHLETHEEKKPCPECGERVRHMKAHILAVHTPDEMKKYQCQDCGKGFTFQNKLEVNRMNIHLKLRPYKCRYGCDISYNDASNRRAHEKKTHGKIFTIVKEEKLKARLQL